MIGIGASPTIQVIAALIAAGLYVATYLCFVRLLRYPRNWLPLRLPETLATGVLAALTVALVALSPDGLDLPAIAISLGFVVVMSCIVAAPAIAFRPAPPLIEFLARHGDHAGLWPLAPALLAGLVIPNVKLQAVLATAMAIELTRALRQYWAGRRRRQYALNDQDLAVLETQAKGDLDAFRSRHGIRELAPSKDAVHWKGCGKNTPPCPFNFYVNRLGLNTAPCCRAHLTELSHYVAACLKELGVVHWLEGGSLLGAVREQGRLLDWEDDIDISVLLDDEMSWQRLSAGLADRCARDGFFIERFEKEGLIAISFDAPKPWPFRSVHNRLRGEIRADLAIYRPAMSFGKAVLERRSYKGAMPATESGGYGVPREIVIPTSTIQFLGGNIACPNRPESYLRVLYGDFKAVEYTYVDAAAADIRREADAAGKTRAQVLPVG